MHELELDLRPIFSKVSALEKILSVLELFPCKVNITLHRKGTFENELINDLTGVDAQHTHARTHTHTHTST